MENIEDNPKLKMMSIKMGNLQNCLPRVPTFPSLYKRKLLKVPFIKCITMNLHYMSFDSKKTKTSYFFFFKL